MIKDLRASEKKIFAKLDSPYRIQDYLDSLKINFELKGDTCYSPRVVINKRVAHCIEAALLAAAAMIYHGRRASKPLLLDLRANQKDFDHVVCLFKQNGLWGAISKSNHSALRFREPIYKSVRELAMSYFHEYFNDTGEKTLREYSKPYSLGAYDHSWITADYDLWQIANEIDTIKHYKILPRNIKLRKADKMELRAGKLTEWQIPKRNLLKYK